MVSICFPQTVDKIKLNRRPLLLHCYYSIIEPFKTFCFSSLFLLLTPSLFLHAFLSLFLSPLGLFHLLVQSALVEVLHHNSNKHVQHEETDNQEERDEVQQHPWVVIDYGLINEETKRKVDESHNSLGCC